MNPLVVMGLGLVVFICAAALVWLIVVEADAPALTDEELDRIFPPKGPIMNLEPMPSEGKAATQSTTLWGLLTALVGLATPLLIRFHITPTDAAQYVEAAQYIITGLGIAVATYGRAHGSAPLPPITSVTPKG